MDSPPRSEILVVLPIHKPMVNHLLHALQAAFPDGGSSKGLRFSVRPHPLCPISASDVRIPARIFSSRFDNLHDTLEDCGSVLFIGSTVGLEAIRSVKPVLRYRSNTLLDIDSVYGPSIPVCDDATLREKVLELVEHGYTEKMWDSAQGTVAELFSPWEPQRFLEIFEPQARFETVIR